MSAVVLRGDAAHLPLPDGSVDLIVTSPPYFGLRAYSDGGGVYAGQIGSEATPREYLDALLTCTEDWIRVLKPGGSMFVNLGDKYSGDATPGGVESSGLAKQRGGSNPQVTVRRQPRRPPVGRPKSLLGLPWRYALRCVDDLGLILRAEVIWQKPNGLPESVTDRVRRSHEQVFHFTKQPRYFSAVDEIREPHAPETAARYAAGYKVPKRAKDELGLSSRGIFNGEPQPTNPLGKLPGSVWEIPSAPLMVPAHLGIDHFAAYPPELCRRIILGWSPSGICTACGEGRRPVVDAVALDMSRPQARRAQHLADKAGLTEDHLQALLSVGISDTGRGAATQSGTGKNAAEVYELAGEARTALGGYAREYLLRRPTGFSYACACSQPAAPTRPAVVVDPFGGTGTTSLVADVLGRTGITIDRSADYCRLARWRTADPGERARALGVPKPPPLLDGQGSLFDDMEAV